MNDKTCSCTIVFSCGGDAAPEVEAKKCPYCIPIEDKMKLLDQVIGEPVGYPVQENKMNFMEAMAEARKGKKVVCSEVPHLIFKWDRLGNVLRIVGGSTPILTSYMLDGEWSIHQETHDWNWAWKQLKAGKKIKKECWCTGSFINLTRGGSLYWRDKGLVAAHAIVDDYIHDKTWVLAE